MRDPVSLHPHQHLVFSLYFILVVLIGHAVISHHHFSLYFSMANDVIHFFMQLSAIHISSLVKCLFVSFAYFLSFFFLAAQCSMQDPSSPTRDQTCVPCSGSTES